MRGGVSVSESSPGLVGCPAVARVTTAASRVGLSPSASQTRRTGSATWASLAEQPARGKLWARRRGRATTPATAREQPGVAEGFDK
jgi:hypothetical protein